MDYFKEIKNVIEEDLLIQRKYDIYKNEGLVKTYFEIGRLLVLAQGGKERAKYGNGLIEKWSVNLSKLYGKGYNSSNLKRMRKFYMIFEKSAPVAHQLTWTNISILLPIDDENKRNYYINMCIKKNLSKRQLLDMIKSNAYERLSYTNKDDIKIISNNNLCIEDMIKDPIYITIENNISNLSEKLLKSIIIEKLENMFIELGVGFTYAGSEIRLGDSYCDLLFFNYELNCFVVLELKVRKLRKEDIGQIDYYINYIDENIRKENHNMTIGLIICKDGNDFILKYCSNKKIYKTTYKLINKELI